MGQLYVARYFPPETKAQMQAMVKNLITAFGARIDRLDWMSPATKVKARQKLATLRVGVGYPRTWTDYRGLQIVKGDAFGNQQRAELFDYQHQLAKLGAPVDKRRMVDVAADRQRGQSAAPERAELPGGHPGTAVSRCRGAGGHQLRHHRRIV